MCIGHDLDLALLDVDDDDFWEKLPLVEIGGYDPSVAMRGGGLPRLASEVWAVGFPVGGDDVSATRGIVSRILVGGLTDNLCVQIDAAINPGNSGGPVFEAGGRSSASPFQVWHANSIGYLSRSPSSTVRRRLRRQAPTRQV